MSDHLRDAVRGAVLLPGDPGFDAARRPWNRAVEQPVAAVVEAADAEDVAALVRHAAAAGLGIATQPNGHGATGRTGGTILLRTGRLDALELDPGARRARIGAGVASGRLQAAAAEHGLTGLPGSSPIVSVAGVALGGGLSWFGRAHGWVAESVAAFEVVDAAGRARRVSAEDDPDLFWALRGGGGDYAVVTALELDLHPAPALYGGRVLWDGAQAPEVLDAFRRITATAPPQLSAWFAVAKFPGGEPVVVVDVAHLGAQDEARELLAPLPPGARADTRRVMSVAEVGSITADPTDPSPGQSRAELLTVLDDTAAKTLLADPVAPMLAIQVRHLGGALAGPAHGPHGPLTEPFAVYMLSLPGDGVLERQRELAAALPVSGRKPLTFLAPHETAADAFAPDALARLRAIKRERDPGNVFRSNFPVTGTPA
ncbi:FAD-binding oxidoreductase [Dactylosporangium darangshiense]|uniref:FAD-binding oxidoreductase n=2 Tax=Dactylosporangium darangshiense TaxID=579108 RepID=A0ABP8DKZ8_9ACTN